MGPDLSCEAGAVIEGYTNVSDSDESAGAVGMVLRMGGSDALAGLSADGDVTDWLSTAPAQSWLRIRPTP